MFEIKNLEDVYQEDGNDTQSSPKITGIHKAIIIEANWDNRFNKERLKLTVNIPSRGKNYFLNPMTITSNDKKGYEYVKAQELFYLTGSSFDLDDDGTGSGVIESLQQKEVGVLIQKVKRFKRERLTCSNGVDVWVQDTETKNLQFKPLIFFDSETGKTAKEKLNGHDAKFVEEMAKKIDDIDEDVFTDEEKEKDIVNQLMRKKMTKEEAEQVYKESFIDDSSDSSDNNEVDDDLPF